MSITEVIKYEGDNKTFIWKHPSEDFNTGSQLVVHETQEAIFFLNGQALDTFGPGRHELETQNLPLLSNVSKITTGSISPFHSEIYFINLIEQMGIRWGTNSKIQFMEPTYEFPLSLGASGEMALAVKEPRRLLLKLVGTEALLTQDKLIGYFKAFLQARIKTYLAQAVSEQKLSIFELDAHLEELSDSIKNRLLPDFAEYGLSLTQMLVTAIVKPDGDPVYERFKDLYFRQYADIREAQIKQQVGVIEQETAAQRAVISARARAEKRQIEGYTYQQERSFDVAEKMAQNEATGEYANMGIGLGVMAGVGGTMGSVMADALSHATDPTGDSPVASQEQQPAASVKSTLGISKFCFECGYHFAKAEKFCPECGTRRS